MKPFSSLLLFGTGTDSIHEVDGSIPVEEFYTASGNVLGASEIVTGIQVPHAPEEEKTTFIKFRVRDAIDFAIISVTTALTLSKGTCRHVRIFLGAMARYRCGRLGRKHFSKGKKSPLRMSDKRLPWRFNQWAYSFNSQRSAEF